MSKAIIPTLDELELKLQTFVTGWKGPTAILGGHYPLNREGVAAVGDNQDEGFGLFSEYTFDLALRLAKRGIAYDKNVGIAVVVDDHSLQINPRWYQKDDGDVDSTMVPVVELMRGHIKGGLVPLSYRFSLLAEALDGRILIASRLSLTALWPESEYRRKAILRDGQDLGCSADYREVVSELCGQGYRNLIALIPLRCERATCSGIDFALQREAKGMRVVQAYLDSRSTNTTPESLVPEGGIPAYKWG
ncbi:hypothetical protein HYV86_04000 [Candidatus Woesearchaeota archaeon]|nr:hypothetical protein [Candidatus Woesearchaeota archaeon]